MKEMKEMKEMKIIITDDIDKDNLIAEIWFKDQIIAEINSEKLRLEIEFNDIKGLQLDLEDLLEAINISKSKLGNG
ncbi:hypothetical protein D3C87_1651210 [compost metagenome]